MVFTGGQDSAVSLRLTIHEQRSIAVNDRVDSLDSSSYNEQALRDLTGGIVLTARRAEELTRDFVDVCTDRHASTA